MAWPNCFSRSKKSVLMCVFPPWKAPHPKKSPPNRKSPPLVGFIRALFVTFRIDWTASGYSNRTCFPCYQLSTNAPSSWDSQPSFFVDATIDIHWYKDTTGTANCLVLSNKIYQKNCWNSYFMNFHFSLKCSVDDAETQVYAIYEKDQEGSSRGCCQGDKGFVMYYMYCTALT